MQSETILYYITSKLLLYHYLMLINKRFKTFNTVSKLFTSSSLCWRKNSNKLLLKIRALNFNWLTKLNKILNSIEIMELHKNLAPVTLDNWCFNNWLKNKNFLLKKTPDLKVTINDTSRRLKKISVNFFRSKQIMKKAKINSKNLILNQEINKVNLKFRNKTVSLINKITITLNQKRTNFNKH